MQAEIERVLKLVEAGKLTAAQGAEMIAALRGVDPATSDRDPGESHGGGRRRRHRHRHRHRHRGIDPEELIERVGGDVERAIDAGTRTLRRVLESTFGERRFDDANSATLSRADSPTGSDFVFSDNRLVVSQLRGLSLTRSTFAGNELNAASIDGVELVDGRMTGLKLRGASLKGVLVERGEIVDAVLNGAHVSGLTVADGRLAGISLNGAHLRDLGISNSRIEAFRIGGSKLKTLMFTADSHARDLVFDGVRGRDWLVDGAALVATRFSGQRIDGLGIKRCGFDDVAFETSGAAHGRAGDALGLVRDVVFERVILKRCRFVDCEFDGARFEGFEATDLEFEGVDFGNQRIDSASALARFAHQTTRV
jgi:uncharacterized protein YjbI with pentapeptide repeats